MSTLSNNKILIIDDEPANLKLLDRMLRGHGYQELELIAHSTQVVSRYLEFRPDLILLDLNMPDMDGYEVMAALRKLSDPLLPPIMILTAQHSRDYLHRALTEGARDFLTKPFDRSELLMRVRNLLDAHLALRMMHDQAMVLEQLVAKRTAELYHTRLQIIQRLGRAAEYRDEETGNHIMRMSQICAVLAKEIGMTASECELILNASPMHDIGKIGIPDNVLLKPAKLTPEEWVIMKTHTIIGERLLDGDDSELMIMARAIARNHHEKWDGSGYPSGLAGEAIPLSARVAAVADVFDALLSCRPYKKSWPIEDAVKYMHDQSGKHFDPSIIAAIDRCLPALLEIEKRLAD